MSVDRVMLMTCKGPQQPARISAISHVHWITFLQVSCSWASSSWLPTVFSCFGDRGPQVSLAQQKGKKTAIKPLFSGIREEQPALMAELFG